MNIVFDLDGTLIDSKLRLYRLFQELVPQSELRQSEYWELKRDKISHQQILSDRFGFDAAAVDAFAHEWMGLIESPDYLSLDSPTPGIHASLSALQESAQLHVCTARQHRASTLRQLENLELLHFFQHVLITEQKHSKESLVRREIAALDVHDWFVGDTGHDVQVGKALGFKTCAVTNGFQNRGVLAEYAPDMILDTASEFSPAHLPAI